MATVAFCDANLRSDPTAQNYIYKDDTLEKYSKEVFPQFTPLIKRKNIGDVSIPVNQS